jgi:hypothetical protein
MFYCNNCAEKNGYPESIGKSLGMCECCGKVAECNDRPSSSLPEPKKECEEKTSQLTTKELLEKYDKITTKANKERALWNLLKANEKHIEGLIEQDATGAWFHKAHRTADVTDSGYMDMAIWILLDEATLFWEMLEENLKS